MMLSTKFGSYQFNGFGVSILNVFPYISLCKMKHPLAGPFFGRFYFYEQTLQPYPKDAVCQISEYLDCQFMRRTFSKSYHILHFIASYGASTGVSPLLCADFNPHSPNMLPTKSVQWFWRVSILNVFPYISLCKMKRPLAGPFLGGFYFYA